MSTPDDLTRIATAPTGSDVSVADDATRVLSADSAAAMRAEESSASIDLGAGALAPGTRLVEFEITRVIGQGGFGVVYEAWDHTLERVVALKEYLPTTLATRAADGTIHPLSERQRETFELGMRSFINEARLLAQFDHPSLVKVYRFWEERGTTYMVMPCYQGRTLRQALAASGPGGVDEAWLLAVVDGVSQALGVMHAAHCFHRDIAPDNIMLLEGSERPVVLDFGAARRVISDKTQAITVILKPGYAPIEQYAEMPDMKQGAWTDVYALAAVMHLAVTGRVPPPSVGRVMTDGYVPLASDAALSQRYSPALLGAIDAGLAVRPEARPQSMAALRALLGLGAAAADGAATVLAAAAPMSSRLAPADPTTQAPSRRTAMPWTILALVLALVAAGGAWWWSQRGPAPKPTGTPAVAQGSPAVARAPAPPAAEPTPASQPAQSTAPPPTPPVPAPLPAARTPAESLRALALGAAADVRVTARPNKPEVAIGKDRLGFSVTSNRAGYVYVFLLDTQGELYMLFPNALDKRNQIAPNQTIELPRASWPMESGGPAGTDRFAVLVSALERDFTQSGVLARGVFAQFPAPVLASLERTRGSGPTPLLGQPMCPGGASRCDDVYGVAHFEIAEK